MPSKTASPLVGALFAMRLSDGQFGACQVVGSQRDGLVVATLDWIGRKPPTKAALAKAKILRPDHHGWRGDEEVMVVRDDVPPALMFVGEAAPRPHDDSPGSGSWSAVSLQILLNWRWKHLIPAKAKRAFAARTTGQVEVDLGAGASTVAKGSPQLSLAASSQNQPTSIDVALPDKPDFSALDRCNKLTELDVDGAAPGLLEYLQTRPIIGKLRWTHHGRQTIDLRRSWLRELSLGWTGDDLTLKLPDQLDTLSLVASGAHHGGRLTVVGGPWQLALELIDAQPAELRGLERVTDLSVLSVPRLRLAPLARQLPAVETLRIGSDTPTTVVNIEALARFRHLAHLTLYEVYGLEPAALPAKGLRDVTIDGTRAAIVPALKARLAGVPRLTIRGAKTDRWISENADNPFRLWADDGAPTALVRDAVKAWKQALAGIDAPRGAVSTVLKAFITTFNRHESAIDTLRAEAIADAFDLLIARSGTRVDANKAATWFDAWRTF